MGPQEGTGRVGWPKSRDAHGAEILWSYWARAIESPFCKTKHDSHFFNKYFDLNG